MSSYLKTLFIVVLVIAALLSFVLMSKINVSSPSKELIAFIPMIAIAFLAYALVRELATASLVLHGFLMAHLISAGYCLIGGLFYRGLIKGIEPLSREFFVFYIKLASFVFLFVGAILIVMKFLSTSSKRSPG